MKPIRTLDEPQGQAMLALMSALRHGVMVHAADGTVLAMNAAAEAALGQAEAELVGHAPGPGGCRLWSEDGAELTAAELPIARAIATGAPVEPRLLRLQRPDGTAGWLELGAAPLPALAGDAPLFACTLVDRTVEVTARRMDEQLRQAQRLESVGRLAGGVAHDFNNALTVILSAAELVRSDLAEGRTPAAQDLEEITRAGARARELTKQLLAFARKQVVSPVVLDLNQAVQANEMMLARLLGEDVHLALRLEEGLWPVRLDPAQVDQALLQLAANARDALPSGGHVVIATRNVRLGREADLFLAAGDWVALSVSDDGVGMAPEVKARAFEPFFTTKEVGRGAGLGLATLHGTVSQAGGCVRVESEPGRGTRFEIFFPRTEPVDEARAAPPAPAAPQGGRELVLLVEDDPAVRALAVRALAGEGYRVVAASSGPEAVEAARKLERAPDLLLTDVIMPRFDGRRLAEILRASWPGLRVLFTSGYAGDRREMASASGEPAPEELLQKPFTGTELLARVRRVIAGPGR
ncbi:MAG: response regulator [Anaeromyxobacter sp.]